MNFFRTSALILLGLRTVIAGAQGTTADSAAAQTPAAKYAEICPGKRDPDTGAIVGRVRDADDGSLLPNATISTDWTEYNLAAGPSTGHRASISTKTSSGGFYLLCGVPINVKLNLRTTRPGYVAVPTPIALDDRIISNVDFALHRVDRVALDSMSHSAKAAQELERVKINAKSGMASLMDRSGFGERKIMGLGAFVTADDIAKHAYSDLIDILQTVRGVMVERGPPSRSSSGIARPMPYLKGIGAGHSQDCIPNFFVDGAQYPIRSATDFADLSNSYFPTAIKGVEVYSNPGTVPIQYDLFSSTGCGSIVIWTR